MHVSEYTHHNLRPSFLRPLNRFCQIDVAKVALHWIEIFSRDRFVRGTLPTWSRMPQHYHRIGTMRRILDVLADQFGALGDVIHVVYF